MVADIQIVQGEFYCTEGSHNYCFSDNCKDNCGFNPKTHEPCPGYQSRSRKQDDGTMVIDEGCIHCKYREIHKGFQAKSYEVKPRFDNWEGHWYATLFVRGKFYHCIKVKIDGITVFGDDSDAES